MFRISHQPYRSRLSAGVRCLLFCLAMFALVKFAQADPIAIVTRTAACAGQAVSGSACAQFYAAPTDADLVRVSPTNADGWNTGTWSWYRDLKVGDKFEGCVTPGIASGVEMKADGSPCTKWEFVAKVAPAPSNEAIAGGNDKVLAAAKSINARTSTTLLAADRKLIKDGLAAIGSADVHQLIAPKVSAPASPPSTPTAPSSPATPGLTAKKWNPGHYLRSSEQAFTSMRALRSLVWAKVCADKNIKGGLVVIPWGTVELGRTQYDFSEVDYDVATLKACGKKIILEVWWMNYWSSIPKPPQGGQAWLPDFVFSTGCASAVSNTANGKGYTVQLHRKECMDPLIGLFQAMGKRYDGNDTVEQIVITEPSTPYKENNADQMHDQYKRLIPAVAQAWPHTGVVFFMNWYPYSRDLFVNYMLPNGVGVGGPDIIPAPRQQDDGSSVLQGLGGDKGTTKYFDQVPVSYSYEASTKDGTPAAVIGYAIDSLRATHLAWVTSSSEDEANFGWNAVIAAIRSRNYQINTAYPTTWK